MSIRRIDKIFSDAATREWRKKMEPLRAVHLWWMQQTVESSVISWEPDLVDRYRGPSGNFFYNYERPITRVLVCVANAVLENMLVMIPCAC